MWSISAAQQFYSFTQKINIMKSSRHSKNFAANTLLAYLADSNLMAQRVDSVARVNGQAKKSVGSGIRKPDRLAKEQSD